MMYDHTSMVKACMEEVMGRKVPDVYLVSVDGELVGTHKIVLRLFSPVLRDLMSQPHLAVSHISLPASGSVLKHLVSMLSKGTTFSADREELKSIGDLSDIIALGDIHWEVGQEVTDAGIEESAQAVDSTEGFVFENEGFDKHKEEEVGNSVKDDLPFNFMEWLDLGRRDPALITDRVKFNCDECLRSFKVKSDLSAHQEGAHGIEGKRGPGRPMKRLEDSYRGRRILKAEEMRKRREEKLERKNLWEKGLCRGPDGKIVSFKEVGKFGSSGSSIRGTEVCSYCGKNFNTKKALRNHEMLHSEEKPYKCDVCYRTFFNKGGLASHQKMCSECQISI